MNNITAETRIRRGPPSPRDRRVRGAPLTSLGAIPHFLGFLNLRLGRKARVAFRVVGILAGAYACSLSAMAAVEEETGQEVSSYAYSETTLLNNITAPFFIDSINDQSTSKYLSTLSNYRGDNGYFDRTIQEYTGGDAAFSRSKDLNGSDDALIPEAVWTLDGSAGAHLDHILGGPGTKFILRSANVRKLLIIGPAQLLVRGAVRTRMMLCIYCNDSFRLQVVEGVEPA